MKIGFTEMSMEKLQLKQDRFNFLVSESIDTGRYERKYPFASFHYSKILHNLFNAGFIRQHESRLISSIYFDTDNKSFLVSNLNGNSNRIKARLRSYNNSKCFNLEFKLKANGIGYKKVLNNFMTKPINFEKINNEIFIQTGYCVKPVSNVSYFREYFIHPHFNIRASVDSSLLFENKEVDFNQFSTKYSVLEFKYPLNVDVLFKKIIHLNFFDIFRFTKFSKYIYSVNQQ